MPDVDAEALLRGARDKGLPMLDEPSAKALLAQCGIASPARRVVEGEHDLARLAALRGPFALKAVSPEILHKSDVGAVRLGLADDVAVGGAIVEMRRSLAAKGFVVRQWLVEQMASGGVECVVGGLHDPEFGPMVMVGIGGIYVEVMRDVAFRICPIERDDAVRMVDELRGAALLRGARGGRAMSVDSLVQALLAVGGEDGLMMRHGERISEVDINPLRVDETSALALDARILLVQGPGRALA